MAHQNQDNLDITKDFYPDLGIKGKSHVYEEGKYREAPYLHKVYPKAKYHRDFVLVQKPGKEYGFNEVAQMVNSAEEETKLGADWKDSPGEFGIVTAPNAEQISEKKRGQGSSWRAATELPPEVTMHHVRFVRAQGMTHINDVAELYTFLGTLGSAQMADFMREAATWKPTKASDIQEEEKDENPRKPAAAKGRR